MPILPPSGPSSSPAQPGSYCPQDALDLVQDFAHGIPMPKSKAAICDMINSMIWTFYPWSWTVKSFTPITCVNGTQDYGVLDSDVLRPLRIRLVNTAVTPNDPRELGFLANLSTELGMGSITSCGYFANGPFIRLCFATSIGTNQTMEIQGEYQMVETRITSSNLTTPFAFPDRYFNVFVEGLKWKIYQLGDDPRAGGAQYTKNGKMLRAYAGQLGLFQESILQMARTEDLQAGDEFMWPEQSLGASNGGWSGIYGF